MSGAAEGEAASQGAERAASLHATAVAVEGRGLLILGPTGSGKSALALDLIALGARLVSDDAVLVARDGEALVARAPARAAPSGDPGAPFPDAALIEARGIGILRVPAAGPTPLALVIDLGRTTTARLPAQAEWKRFGVTLPLIARPARLHPAAVRAAVISGGPLDPEASLGLASCQSEYEGSRLRAESGCPGGVGSDVGV